MIKKLRHEQNRKPFVLQGGASDGTAVDHVCYSIIKNNFPAILLEPHPIAFKMLEANYIDYPNVICFNVEISIKVLYNI